MAVLTCQGAAAQTPLKLILEGNLGGPAAPFTIGLDKGYYAAEELDVTIEPTRDAAQALQALASGSYDLGFVDINAFIRFRARYPEAPIRAVFMVYDRPAYAVIGRKSRGVIRPKDLEGKKLGAPTADPAASNLPLFLKANAVEAPAIAVLNIGIPVREPMLAAGEVDAVTGLAYETFVDLQERGVPADDISMMLMADYGVPLYGSAILVNPESFAAKGDAVKAFLRAFLKGLKSTVRDPGGAIEPVVRRNPALDPRVEAARLQLAIRQNIRTPEALARGYGGVDTDRLEQSIEQIGAANGGKIKLKAADVFDPAFLPSQRRAQ